MDDDVAILDMACPKCGAWECLSQTCTGWCDEDGMIDEYEEDPINASPGDFYTCPTCHGSGHHHWCRKCGYNITAADFEADRLKSRGDA